MHHLVLATQPRKNDATINNQPPKIKSAVSKPERYLLSLKLAAMCSVSAMAATTPNDPRASAAFLTAGVADNTNSEVPGMTTVASIHANHQAP